MKIRSLLETTPTANTYIDTDKAYEQRMVGNYWIYQAESVVNTLKNEKHCF